MATLAEFSHWHNDFKAFIVGEGKTIDVGSPPIITLDDLTKHRRKISSWNRRNPNNKIVKLGMYSTLQNNKITTNLVGLNSSNDIVLGGGGAGEGPPFYR